jgi:MFS family permease
LSFVPVTIGAVSGVSARETGVASGLLNTSQQTGGALGLAVLSTIAVSVTTTFVATRPHSPKVAIAGLTHGFSVAFWFGALLAGVGGIVALVGLARSASHPTEMVPALETT